MPKGRCLISTVLRLSVAVWGLSLQPAWAGWTPLVTLDPTGGDILLAASRRGVLAAGVSRYIDPNMPRLYLLDEAWLRVSEPPVERVAQLAFQGETLLAATLSNFESDLRLARRAETGWRLSDRLFGSLSNPYGFFTAARLLPMGASTAVVAVNTESEGCGGYSDTLLACVCTLESCRGDSRIEGPTSYYDVESPFESLALLRNPESLASVLTVRVPYQGSILLERSVPDGRELTRLELDQVLRHLNAVRNGRFLDVLGLVSESEYEYDAESSLLTAARARSSVAWTSGVKNLPSIRDARSLAACQVGKTVYVAWAARTPRGAPAKLLYLRRDAGAWSREQGIPGTDYCSGCATGADEVEDLAVACTDTELHVLWTTERRGLRHTAFAPLSLETVRSTGSELVIDGRGFSRGLRVKLGQTRLRVLEVGPRRVRVRPPTSSPRGTLRVTNPDGESASIPVSFGLSGDEP